jgi:beta-glucanase (GH16 family)
MRRMFFLLVAGTMQIMFFVGTAWAQDAGSFVDGFDRLDAARWSASAYRLGCSYLDPANVGVDGGNLSIAIPARTLEGDEILTNDLHGYGSYSASIKLPYAPGSVTGFFLCKSPDYESEIDIELFNDSSRRIMFTTYAGGRQTHTTTLTLTFDPTADVHEYRFDYAPDSVSFYADEQLMQTWTDDLPRTSMHQMLNTWFPTWLDGRMPKKTVYTYVDWIRYVQ